jgi:hypothetical protein
MRIVLWSAGAFGCVSRTGRPDAMGAAMGYDHRPDPKAFIENRKGQLPVHRKFMLFLKNNARKMLTSIGFAFFWRHFLLDPMPV